MLNPDSICRMFILVIMKSGCGIDDRIVVGSSDNDVVFIVEKLGHCCCNFNCCRGCLILFSYELYVYYILLVQEPVLSIGVAVVC